MSGLGGSLCHLWQYWARYNKWQHLRPNVSIDWPAHLLNNLVVTLCTGMQIAAEARANLLNSGAPHARVTATQQPSSVEHVSLQHGSGSKRRTCELCAGCDHAHTCSCCAFEAACSVATYKGMWGWQKAAQDAKLPAVTVTGLGVCYLSAWAWTGSEQPGTHWCHCPVASACSWRLLAQATAEPLPVLHSHRQVSPEQAIS